MYFVKKNISDFFKNHKDMFFIFFILQIISVFFIFFIYGLLVNYQKELDNMTYDTFEFTADFSSDNEANEFLPLTEGIDEILDNMGDNVCGFTILGVYHKGDEKYAIHSHNGYIDGNKYSVPRYSKPFKITKGRALEENDFQGEDYVAIASDFFEVNKEIELGGNKYTVVGNYEIMLEDMPYLQIPYLLLPKSDYYVIGLYVHFTNNPTEHDYDVFKSALSKHYGENVSFDELYLDKPARKKTLNSMNFVAVIIGVLASINIIVIYMNLIGKRRKKNAIIQICGYSYKDMCLSLFIEIEILNLTSFLAGAFSFMIIYKMVLVNIFSHFWEVFSVTTVCKLSIIYLGLTTIVATLLAVLMNKREPLHLLRRTYYV